jgi:4-amino-4-deoxy-L-arabinose transferase-like glycosyltransferase
MRLSQTQWMLLLFVTNLCLGLAFCFLFFPMLGEVISGLDPDGYGNAGRIWYESGRFTTISRAPLYPAFVALVSWFSGGYRIAVIQIAQCVLLALGVVILYLLFRRTLDGDEGMARLASLACALYPILLWYAPRLWTETFLTFMLALFTLALVRLLQEPSSARALFGGLMAGALALSKGIALVFTPLSVLILLASFRRSGWRLALLFGAAALALIAPWTWRNWRLSGAFLPIHTDGGYNFYLGNGFARHWLEAPFSYTELKALSEEDIAALYARLGSQPSNPALRDRILLSAALAEFRAAPLRLPRKLLIQSLTFWYLAADFPKSLLTGALQIPIALLALPGILSAFKRRSWASSLVIPIAGIMGISVLVFAFARLSSTIMPYMIALLVFAWQPRLKRFVRMHRIRTKHEKPQMGVEPITSALGEPRSVH